MKKLVMASMAAFLMALFSTSASAAITDDDDGYLNPVTLDERYYLEQLERFEHMPDRIGLICWASYEIHKEGKHGNALRILHSCADKGLVASMLMLSNMYELGLLHEGKQLALSTLWLRRAAITGDSRGQLYYGLALLEGKGTVRNKQLGQQWIELAAAQGDTTAQEILMKLTSVTTS